MHNLSYGSRVALTCVISGVIAIALIAAAVAIMAAVQLWVRGVI